jgi:hypothetical protein
MTPVQSGVQKHRLFATLTVAAVAMAAVVWLGMPHQKAIPNIGVLLVKLAPFVLAVEALAAMDLGANIRRRLALAAIPICFLAYFTYFVPKIFFAMDSPAGGTYYLVLTLTPFVILSLVLAYRLGGGSASMARRLGYAMILLQLSGLEDLAYLTINHQTDPKWTPIPQVWSWADHMSVFLGHPLTKNQAFTFIAIHVVLAILTLVLPTRFFLRPSGKGTGSQATDRVGAATPVAAAAGLRPDTSREKRATATPGN